MEDHTDQDDHHYGDFLEKIEIIHIGQTVNEALYHRCTIAGFVWGAFTRFANYLQKLQNCQNFGMSGGNYLEDQYMKIE